MAAGRWRSSWLSWIGGVDHSGFILRARVFGKLSVTYTFSYSPPADMMGEQKTTQFGVLHSFCLYFVLLAAVVVCVVVAQFEFFVFLN